MKTDGMTQNQKVEYYKQFERELKAKKKQAFKEKLTSFKEGVKLAILTNDLPPEKESNVMLDWKLRKGD